MKNDLLINYLGILTSTCDQVGIIRLGYKFSTFLLWIVIQLKHFFNKKVKKIYLATYKACWKSQKY